MLHLAYLLLVSPDLPSQKHTDIDYNAITVNQVYTILSFSLSCSIILLFFSFPCETRWFYVYELFSNFFPQSGILNDIFNVLRFWKSRKYLQSNMWLQSWLRRELQALIQEEDVDIIVHHIHGVVDSFFRRIEQTHLPKKTAEGKQQDFRIAVSDAAKPFLLARTERFVNELELFLASGLNIEAYDAVYMQRLGWNTPGGTSVSMPAEEPSQRTGVVPYLYIFDADSDNDQ
ncbi:hypothetical protein PTKIN_Ptkin01aG0322000 [Pterospermum kingtungense]